MTTASAETTAVVVADEHQATAVAPAKRKLADTTTAAGAADASDAVPLLDASDADAAAPNKKARADHDAAAADGAAPAAEDNAAAAAEADDADDVSIYPDAVSFYCWLVKGEAGPFLAAHPASTVESALEAFKQLSALPEDTDKESDDYKALLEDVNEVIDDAYCISLEPLSFPNNTTTDGSDAKMDEAVAATTTTSTEEVTTKDDKKDLEMKEADEKKKQESDKPDTTSCGDEPEKKMGETATAEEPLVAPVMIDCPEMRDIIEKMGESKKWMMVTLSREPPQADMAAAEAKAVNTAATTDAPVKAISVTVADFDPRGGLIIPKIGVWKYLSEITEAPEDVSNHLKTIFEKFA